jgi:hypothetical protein
MTGAKKRRAAVLHVAQRGLGEGDGSATTVDRLLEELGFAFSADLLGDPPVANSSAFLNANSADGAAHDPERRSWSADEP